MDVDETFILRSWLFFVVLWLFTSSLLTSRFLIAFCAAALVAMRRPSAASRNFCCCSSLSGFAAAP